MSLPVAPSLLASLQDHGPDSASNGPTGPNGSNGAHGLLPELSVADLAMSLSPKHHQHQHLLQTQGQLAQHPHSTPFSVTDILSPMDEFRKLELSGAGSSSSSAGTPAPPPNPAPYVQFPPQYCAPELAYGDVRGPAIGPAAGWYGTAGDPRFASECECECQVVVSKVSDAVCQGKCNHG